MYRVVSKMAEDNDQPIIEKKEKEDPQPPLSSNSDELATLSLIDKANAAAERIENAQREMMKLTQKLERFEAEKLLSGVSLAGKEEKKEESPSEYMKRVMNGEINGKEN